MLLQTTDFFHTHTIIPSSRDMFIQRKEMLQRVGRNIVPIGFSGLPPDGWVLTENFRSIRSRRTQSASMKDIIHNGH